MLSHSLSFVNGGDGGSQQPATKSVFAFCGHISAPLTRSRGTRDSEAVLADDSLARTQSRWGQSPVLVPGQVQRTRNVWINIVQCQLSAISSVSVNVHTTRAPDHEKDKYRSYLRGSESRKMCVANSKTASLKGHSTAQRLTLPAAK